MEPQVMVAARTILWIGLYFSFFYLFWCLRNLLRLNLEYELREDGTSPEAIAIHRRAMRYATKCFIAQGAMLVCVFILSFLNQ